MQGQRSRRASRVARPIHGSSLAQRCAGSSSAPQRGCTDSARGCTGNAWLTAAGGSAARPRVRLPPSPTRRGVTGRLSIADGCRASYGYGGEPVARARQTPPSTLAAHLSVGVFPAARRSRWLSRCTRTAQSATQRRRRSRAAQATPALSVAARSEPRRDPAAAPAANSQKSRVECRGLVVLTNVTRARSAAAASPSDGPAPFPTRATLDARQPASLWPDRLRHAGGVARGAHCQGRSKMHPLAPVENAPPASLVCVSAARWPRSARRRARRASRSGDRGAPLAVGRLSRWGRARGRGRGGGSCRP